MIYAVSGKKVGKRGAKSIISASVFNVDDYCVILDAKTRKPLLKYEIDTRRAVVVKQGILRSRPKFEDWACELELEIDEDMIPVSLVLENLNEAGMLAGIGDYRINKGGPFGRYKVELVS